MSGPEEARALLDARGERLTCRQRRLLDALRTLCARQHLEVDLSPHAAALLPVSAKSEGAPNPNPRARCALYYCLTGSVCSCS